MKKLELTDEQLNVVISGLGELPLRVANATFQAIVTQINNTASDLMEEKRAEEKGEK